MSNTSPGINSSASNTDGLAVSNSSALPTDQLEQTSLEWLNDYGDQLYNYALQRVGSIEQAEELVQETFLGAIRNIHQFNGESTPKTWLFGILRHKLVDHYRQKATVASLTHVCDSMKSDASKSHRSTDNLASKPWSDPTTCLHDTEFRQVVRQCIASLPDLIRQAFEFRFYDQMDSDEVCQLQRISANNLAARMYRARTFLRECLTRNWFQG